MNDEQHRELIKILKEISSALTWIFWLLLTSNLLYFFYIH